MELKTKQHSQVNWQDFKRPFFIAGPCSVESEKQVFEVAETLAKNPSVKALRGGIWKPRTRPNSFEGMGTEALPWLKNAGKAVGLPVMTEVANTNHVEQALKANIDMLWIGARTSVNPFSVQEIADALKGIDIPVFVKNPVTPDLQLWIGAIERMQKAGLEKIVAIHRGFTTHHKSIYRNEPMWDIAIALKSALPEIPMVCDPSHIGGSRDLLLPIAQRALDLNMDGIMIETHPNPDLALSDAQQQITPDNFNLLTAKLVLRQEKSESEVFVSQLQKLRDKIDVIDDNITDKLFERLALVNQIGQYKKENNVTILQLERWQEILKRQLSNANQNNLNDSFIKNLFLLIHDESIRIQTEIMNKG